MSSLKRTRKRAARTKRPPRQTFRFSLLFTGHDELTDELEDAILDAGCDDATLGIQDGVLFLDFAREAPSFLIALFSAIADIQRADVGLELVRVEPI